MKLANHPAGEVSLPRFPRRRGGRRSRHPRFDGGVRSSTKLGVFHQANVETESGGLPREIDRHRRWPVLDRLRKNRTRASFRCQCGATAHRQAQGHRSARRGPTDRRPTWPRRRGYSGRCQPRRTRRAPCDGSRPVPAMSRRSDVRSDPSRSLELAIPSHSSFRAIADPAAPRTASLPTAPQASRRRSPRLRRRCRAHRRHRALVALGLSGRHLAQGA